MRIKDAERAKRKRPVRATTVNMRRFPKGQLATDRAEFAEVIPINQAQRPKVRADCIDGPRPCPWVSCRHHLYADVAASNGSIKLNFAELEPDELTGRLESCSLDVADGGSESHERVGELLNVTREAVRLIEQQALRKIRLPLLRELDEDEQ